MKKTFLLTFSFLLFLPLVQAFGLACDSSFDCFTLSAMLIIMLSGVFLAAPLLFISTALLIYQKIKKGVVSRWVKIFFVLSILLVIFVYVLPIINDMTYRAGQINDLESSGMVIYLPTYLPSPINQDYSRLEKTYGSVADRSVLIFRYDGPDITLPDRDYSTYLYRMYVIQYPIRERDPLTDCSRNYRSNFNSWNEEILFTNSTADGKDVFFAEDYSSISYCVLYEDTVVILHLSERHRHDGWLLSTQEAVRVIESLRPISVDEIRWS